MSDLPYSAKQYESTWPLSQFPALDPADFPTPESLDVLRKPHDQLKQEVRSGANVSLSWVNAFARDGTELPVLVYQSAKSDVSDLHQRPLVVAIHGGGRCSGANSSLVLL